MEPRADERLSRDGGGGGDLADWSQRPEDTPDTDSGRGAHRGQERITGVGVGGGVSGEMGPGHWQVDRYRQVSDRP